MLLHICLIHFKSDNCNLNNIKYALLQLNKQTKHTSLHKQKVSPVKSLSSTQYIIRQAGGMYYCCFLKFQTYEFHNNVLFSNVIHNKVFLFIIKNG